MNFLFMNPLKVIMSAGQPDLVKVLQAAIPGLECIEANLTHLDHFGGGLDHCVTVDVVREEFQIGHVGYACSTPQPKIDL